MNQVRSTLALTRQEIENGTPDSASWHQDYRHSAYVFIGGLPYELSEGDIIAIFSQYGEPVHLHLARDKDTGKSRGFGWLKYEDQRSTNLAVDNLTGSVVLGRTIRVDHAEYKHKEGDGAEEAFQGLKIGREARRDEGESEERRSKRRRRDESEGEDENGGLDPEEVAERMREDRELAKLERDHDDDDPMKDYLIREKKKEIEEARAERENRKSSSRRKDKKGSSDHRSRRHRRDDKDRSGDEKDGHRHRSHRGHRDRDRKDESDDRHGRHRDRDHDRRRDIDEKDRDTRGPRKDRGRECSPSDADRERQRRDDSADNDGRRRRKDDNQHQERERRHRDDDSRDHRKRRDSRERS